MLPAHADHHFEPPFELEGFLYSVFFVPFDIYRHLSFIAVIRGSLFSTQ
jgi:hypothetical protein